MEATFDLPTPEVLPDQRDDLFQYRPEQKSGFDGIKQIFEMEESGIVNPKYRLIGESCAMGYFLGFVVGGKNGIKYGMKDYPAANRHKKFDSIKDALVIYRDRMMMEYFRVGMAAGIKLGIFVSSSLLISFGIAAYRGKYSPLDPVVALSITGSLNCVRHGGPRQVALGGLLGGAMGAALSLPVTAFLYLSGVTMEDIVHMKRKMLLNDQARLAFQRKFEQVMDCEDYTIPSTIRELELWEPPEESAKK